MGEHCPSAKDRTRDELTEPELEAAEEAPGVAQQAGTYRGSGQARTHSLVRAPTPTIPWEKVCWTRGSSQEYGGAPGRT